MNEIDRFKQTNQAAEIGAQSAGHPVQTAAINIGLNAAIVSCRDDNPQILVMARHETNARTDASLPYGPFTPITHRTLELGLRALVVDQTGLDLGYVEQLYTFADRGRHAQPGDKGPHVVSIGYLALTRADANVVTSARYWLNWYEAFPWEDWRHGKPAIITLIIEPRLREWASRTERQGIPLRPLSRAERLKISFGLGGAWDEEKVLERYELLYEAGLVAEALRDGREAARSWTSLPLLGTPMQFDHRRILATAISRLRGKN